ncbi:methyltransferase domain-containing protein [Umezawaea endophytica]|uniref:Class I SAM-dependent methyltransferase n=1 Tax=Umezawaea endophytica TaxID=1654476 RepID=A0A9X2VMT4_9PSEU|nr:class I SAM-dependent methyltransferase [Umezawaea endophytica]MCS7479396.1 class I SAM-dependent methyltransferase [Umezawaea endophytica]
MLDLLETFACPFCHGALTTGADGLRCPACAADYPSAAGYVDFAPAITMKPGLGPFYLQDPLHVTRYERATRDAFLEIMGENWDRDLTPDREDDYLRTALDAADGLVLDLACGSGRWTRTLVEHLGGARVVGLDLSVPMIDLIRASLPDLCVVRGTALRLPFADRSLGAVNCSNALQLLPDPRSVLREAGRCLRPGGLFTAFTFRRADRPAYRYFQSRHERTFNVRAFRTTELVTWLASAGLELVDLRTPAGMLLFTARRTTEPHPD